MVPDVSTGDTMRMLCLHCARKIVSPKPTTKYGELTRYLKFRGDFTDTVKLSFTKIDGIIGDNLPMSAYKTEQWWNNSPSSPHARAWLDAGWNVQEVNLKEAYAVFKKVKELPPRRGRKISRSEIKKPFTPVRVRAPKRKTLSKTKVSKLYARIKNLERQRASVPRYVGSFKSKPMHEKRLYRSEEKPQ
jgi:hypothetical protein